MTQVVLPYRTTLSQGKPEHIAEVLADMDAITTVVNGQLTNDNLSSSAALQVPKLGISGVPDKTKYLRDDGTWQVPSGSSLRTIEDKTLTTDTDFVFSAIPLTFKHLMIYGYFRSNRPAANQADLRVRFNEDDQGNYDYYSFQIDSAGTPPNRNSTEGLTDVYGAIINAMGGATSPADVYSTFTLWIPNYADTVSNKSYIYMGACKITTTTQTVIRASGYWRSSAAITKVTFMAQGGTIAAASRAQLFGLT